MQSTEKYNSTLKFDFLFIGLGAANCLLILRLHENGLLNGKTIAIIEPDGKTTNDRTFCFWATEQELFKLKLNTLVSYSWSNIEISGIAKQPINPLHYFHVKGIDLYHAAKSCLLNCQVTNFATFFTGIPDVKAEQFELKLENETLRAKYVFDSRPPVFLKPKNNQTHLYQSFFGWKIKTDKKTFDTSTMVMMDFNVPQNNFTQFVYTLPFTEDTALIELTRFGTQKLLKSEAELILDEYSKALGVSFEIIETEQGVIPMSSANMEKDHYGSHWVNMGVKADMLKCTTGYAFHAMAEDAIVQMEAIKNNQLQKRIIRKKRFGFYDRLLLKILTDKPEYGKIIFETLFKKVALTNVLSFLREKTSMAEEVLIFSKLQKRLFIKAAVKDVFQRCLRLPLLFYPFLFTILAVLLSVLNFEYIAGSILVAGFLTVGLAHGALDHLTSRKVKNHKQLFYFMLNYVLKGVLLGFIWYLFPDVALLIFMAYSMWHFGQADFKEWNLIQGLSSFFWGFTVLMTILSFHFVELSDILKQIPNLQIAIVLEKISEGQILLIQILTLGLGLLLSVLNKSKYMLLTLIYLLLSSMLPLLISFGIYFVGQHSMHGWRHLSTGLNERSSTLWKKSLPFSIGGAMIILYALFFAGQQAAGLFFIVLSCLSIPHVLKMHQFYAIFHRS